MKFFSLIQNLDRGKDILSELRSMGLRIELDDFGTGYSSLSILGKLPLDTIKLDRSFINGIHDDGSGNAIIRAAIVMAMALDVIAEGVETRQQSRFLIQEGCDTLQGFLYARPMSFADFETYLQRFPNTEIDFIALDSIERLQYHESPDNPGC
jgi:EAL domain-containing protein (putative c-di-GMP-specific phosphodiesterase class I)